jgi:amidase
MTPDDITSLSADALSRAIHARTISCREVMQAYLARIHAVNPRFNAIVSLAPEGDLIRQADERDAELARGQWRGWMHGMPQAIKDAAHAKGFPTTCGCTLLADAMAPQDGVMTARMKASGCIVIGKTNMPELGLGSHTFNDLFGATRNAWDPAVSAGGSSGGAAVALAQRLLPVADGSDFMGSLRNPAAWNHVWGMRPSQGRVPAWPVADVWVSQLGTEGPMARNVTDLARLLEVQAGRDDRAGLSIDGAIEVDLPRDTAPLKGLRIGWLGDLKGHLAVEPGLLERCEQALQRMAGEGAIVTPIAPNFDADEVWNAWLVWRRALAGQRAVPLLQQHPNARERLKPEVLWEHDQAIGTGVLDFMLAAQARTRYLQQVLALFETVDVLALPVTQVWPFPIDERWPRRVAGREMDTYHRWMECTLYATFAGLPAASAPAGFHENGRWPAGVQLMTRPRADAQLLRVLAAYEFTLPDWRERRPA